MVVLDASALLAFMFREAGHERVNAVLDDACMSTVNVAEVLGRFARDGHSPAQVWQAMQATAVEWVPLGSRDAVNISVLAPIAQQFGLSLADRACLALARSRNMPVLTADRIWANVDVGIDVEVIR